MFYNYLVAAYRSILKDRLYSVINIFGLAVGIARGVEITEIGCPFFNRCPIAIDGTCDVENAPIREPSPEHFIACHRTMDEIVEVEDAPQQILHGFEKAEPDGDKAAKAH